MRKIIIAVLCFLMSGCALQANLERRQAIADANSYVAQNKPKAHSGEMKWSTYYKGGYELFAKAGAPGDMLARINEAIHASEEYEQGKMSQNDFEYVQRSLDAQDRTARQVQDQQERVQRAQLAAAQMAAAAQMLQASGPHTIAPTNAPAPSPGYVIAGMLESQSDNGSLRYCRYSNGVVNTISVMSFCPMRTQ